MSPRLLGFSLHSLFLLFTTPPPYQMLSGSGAGEESWRNNADTHQMRPEDIKKHGVEGSKRTPGHNPGEVLHQRRNLPFSPAVMAAAGFLIVGAIGYLVLYKESKPGTKPSEVAKVAAGVSDNDGSWRPNK